MEEEGEFVGESVYVQYVFSAFLLSPKNLYVWRVLTEGTEQSDEDWLTPFEKDITTSWDFTAIHINTISMDVVKKDLVRLSLSQILRYH